MVLGFVSVHNSGHLWNFVVMHSISAMSTAVSRIREFCTVKKCINTALQKYNKKLLKYEKL